MSKIIGSRAQVWHGTATHTSGGLIKSDLMMNKHKRIVSKRRHALGQSAIKHLEKSGHKGKLPNRRAKADAKGSGNPFLPYGEHYQVVDDNKHPGRFKIQGDGHDLYYFLDSRTYGPEDIMYMMFNGTETKTNNLEYSEAHNQKNHMNATDKLGTNA